MLIWRGWGWIVFFMPLTLWIAIIIVLGNYKDSLRLPAFDIVADRAGALSLALSAVLLWFISRYRTRMGADHDSFAYIPMKYWTYVFVVGAVGMYISSYFRFYRFLRARIQRKFAIFNF